MLSKELGTLLTGCYLNIELYPFSFIEFLRYNKNESLVKEHSGTVKKAKIQTEFNKYLHSGGFPMYLSFQDDVILKTLYENILYKDVMVRNNLTKEKELKELMYFLMSNIGKPHTYSSLCKLTELKNASTIKNYITYIENTYLIFALSKLDYSVRKQLYNPKKIYAIDNAMSSRLGFHFSGEQGRLLENLVFIELKRRTGEIFYHNSGNSECDFIVRDGYRVVDAIQVCYLFNDQKTKDREIKGLLNAMKTYNLNEAYILTNSHEEVLHINEFTVNIRPAWKWFINS